LSAGHSPDRFHDRENQIQSNEGNEYLTHREQKVTVFLFEFEFEITPHYFWLHQSNLHPKFAIKLDQ